MDRHPARAQLTALVITLCCIPFMLNLVGIDFSSSSNLPIGHSDLLADKADIFKTLNGEFHHALLEWTAVSIAVLTAILTFAHFARFKDLTIPTIGLALLCAGAVDGFHTLAATRLIEANSPNEDFIPFTWALSRFFNAIIMIIGASISLWLTHKGLNHAIDHRYTLKYLVTIGLAFVLSAYVLVHIAAVSESLPKTMFEGAFVSRPFDVLPLGLFLFSAALFWTWYKSAPSRIRFSLFLACFPEIFTQIHMAFGSTALYDNHFNIAHGLKILAYGSIFIGVIIDIIIAPAQTIQETPEPSSGQTYRGTSASKALPIGKVERPLSILIPSAAFVLAATISLVVSFTFYIENEKYVSKNTLENLANDAELIEPRLQDLYKNATHDVLFLSKTPPISGIANAVATNDINDLNAWKSRLTTIFNEFLAAKPLYQQLRFIGVADSGKEIINVKRINNLIETTPNSRLASQGKRNYFKSALHKSVGEVYFSDIELTRENGVVKLPYLPVLRIATPVFDSNGNKIFGIIIINIEFEKFLKQEIARTIPNIELLVTNRYGGYLYHQDPKKSYSFDLNKQGGLYLDFPSLRNIFDREDATHTFEMLTDVNGKNHMAVIRKIETEKFGSSHPIYLTMLKSHDTFLTDVVQVRNQTLMLGLALAFIALGIAIVFGRRLAEPISIMTDAVKQYENSGTIGNLPIDNKNEVGVFARSFYNLFHAVNDALYTQEQASKHLAAILNSAADAIITIDAQGKILSFNQAASKIFGYDEEEIISRPVTALMLDEDAKMHQDYINRHISTASKDVLNIERSLSGRRKNGDVFPLTLSIAEVETEQGLIFSGILRDISEQKQLEEEKAIALEEAKESSRLKAEFLASMSHEIRTPINGVIGMLNLLRKDSLAEISKHKVKLAHTSAESLLTLINDILDFSKIEAQKLEIEIVEFDIQELLSTFIETYAHKSYDKNIEMILDATLLNHTVVSGDPGRLRQILSNLVSNALKFTESGEIIVRAAMTSTNDGGLNLCCTVSDSGIGIEESKLSTIFDSFTQADASTTRKFGGTGLGLAIVKQLCACMGGDISVNSKINQGSTFTFNIHLEHSPQDKPFRPVSTTKKLHVLVLDDNLIAASVIASQLISWDIKTHTATTVEKAKNYLASERNIDLILVDSQIINFTEETLTQIFELDHYKKLPTIVAMTPLIADDEAKKLEHDGYTAYFPKPATPKDLCNCLNALMEDKFAQGGFTTLNANLEQNKLDHVHFNQDTRILLVEDNAINQEVILGLFENTNIQCDVAGNGLEALCALQQTQNEFPYHLILMDCQMPEMDGFAATEAIRQGEGGKRYTNIPIIAMTANAMMGDRERCLKTGMNDYLTKPVDEEKLFQAMTHWLEVDTKKLVLSKDDSGKQTMQAQQKENQLYKRDSDLTPIWDEEDFIQRTKGRTDRASRLINMFLKEIPTEVDELLTSIREQDLKKAASCAHTVKGVSGNVSASLLAEDMLKIEQACKTEDHQTLAMLAAKSKQDFYQLKAQLSQYITKL